MNFEKEVLAKSNSVPVLVDFWAPWCQPCRILGPDIEDLASHANGKWELVKVNTDEQPQLMQRYGIRGIPAVKLFDQGEVIAEFTGALPKYQIEQWLEEHLSDPRKETLNQLIQSGDTEGLSDFAKNNPDLIEAQIGLARLVLLSNPQQSLGLIESVHQPGKYYDELEQLKQLANFMVWSSGDTLPIADKLRQAQQAAKNESHDEAIKLLIDAVMMNKNYSEDLPRKTCIAYFQWLGTDHEVTKAHRRRFDMALY